MNYNQNENNHSDPDKNDNKQPKKESFDDMGVSKSLKDAITQKYEIFDVIGKGTFGFVTQGKCLTTKKPVALKVMINQVKSDYDCIRLIREIQIMRKLNDLSAQLLKQTSKPTT